MKKKHFFFLLIIIILSSCKEKLTEEQMIDNDNKKVVDSLTHVRENMHPEYRESGKSELVANNIIDNCFSVLDIDRENLDAVKDLAHFNYELKNYKEAVQYYSMTIDIKEKKGFKDLDFEFLQRGKAKYYLQDFNGAIEDLKKYKAANNDKTTVGYTEACYFSGTCYRNLNDQFNACNNFRIYAENIGTDEAWKLIAEYCN